MKGDLIINPLKKGINISETGNKAKSLLFLQKKKFRIPPTYILTSNLHYRYLQNKELFIGDLRKELLKLPDRSYAIRSSSQSEDSEDFTYAGQFLTFTNVSGTENLLNAILKVWDTAPLCKETIYHRRNQKELRGCAVLIQEMIHSKLAGVSFSKNPITNQQEIIVEAVEGPGEDLVQRGLTPFRWKFKNHKLFEGNPDHPMISAIMKVGADTAKLMRIYGNHVDIEWVFDGEQLYYLQFLPVTGTREMNIYSNKMAKEMLPGQIKPLVWSVNIPLVNGTWIKLLSEITGPLKIAPEDLAKPFYYRTYFNIAALTRIFKEFGLSTDVLENIMMSNNESKPAFKPGLRTLQHLPRIIKFIHHKLTFENTFLKEYQRLKNTYNDIEEKIKREYSIDSYHELFALLSQEGRKLAYLNIIIPLLMQIFNKRLKSKMKKRGLDYDRLDFNADFEELINLSPIPHIRKIKGMMDSLPPNLRSECTSIEKPGTLPEVSDINREINIFRQKFGHLSESGNDFSVPKWSENPEIVYNMIMKSESVQTRTDLFTFSELIQNNRKKVRGLHGSYIRAGRYKVYREQISSLFTYGHGLFRTLYLNLGKDLKERHIINSKEDIFYLERREIASILEDMSENRYTTYDDLITSRKNEMELTRDFILPAVIFGEKAPVLEIGRIKNHYGIGTSAGTYTGPTKVIRGMSDFESVNQGDIVIIPFSDVSWTPILTIAGAIVSETGGLLSHCSIIAREMGIPALVSVENACATGTGLRATVDGSNGILTIHDYE